MTALNFDWDPDKAAQNRRKHGISFTEAATVFRDPLAVTVFDEEHSEEEERWITLGISSIGRLLVIHHTLKQTDATEAQVRIISTRKAAGQEITIYSEQVK